MEMGHQKFSGTLSHKWVYLFGADKTEGDKNMKDLLGGKGANLAEMSSMGLPVPPGFTISTEVCKAFYENKQSLPDSFKEKIEEALQVVERKMGRRFGDPKNPLLVSVRSGARVSMPGMMDTILNLGLNKQTVQGLAQNSGQERFAWDSYRRFLQMYSNVVMGMNASFLEIILEDMKVDKGYEQDTDLTLEDLKVLVEKFKAQILERTQKIFPEDPKEQLWEAVCAVFKSWMTPRAVTYRRLHGFQEEWGTAVNVQAMVFGNMGEDSATGVAFTRDPSTGEKSFYGEFLLNAQGEDVVAGVRTPFPISKKDRKGSSLEEVLPNSFSELKDICHKLEHHFRDMQDLEFTVEKNKLWMLQTRKGKRTASAALKVACDMMDEGLIDEKEALRRLEPQSLEQLLHPCLDPNERKNCLAKGLPASPGGAVGTLVFTSEEAVERKKAGEKTILVRVETSPEDIEGMIAAQGILTTRGGMTSHAAVVARGMGKCCVAGCSEAQVKEQLKEVHFKGKVFKQGDFITLDGSTGEVFEGKVKTIEPSLDENFKRIMRLADKHRRLGVRVNADTLRDAQIALELGAEGIGLCRTEHMFFASDRIDVVRRMILADSKEQRQLALDELLPMQKEDFRGLFEVMQGRPVTIRLLDPPLHEFLPQTKKEMKPLAERLGWSLEKLSTQIRSLHEFNPMLGHRGCRLAITFPEIYAMQSQALAEAASEVVKAGKKVSVEIMIPLVGFASELKDLRALVQKILLSVQETFQQKFDFKIGTMIELPRAALTAGEIAKEADFFSFGTNDLTQTALGISRDDCGRFLSAYLSRGFLSHDPFVRLDQEGVGQLVMQGVKKGKAQKPSLKLGICGEHGGDPESVFFFHKIGLDYVSCSPYRVPIARLAAAQAQLEGEKKG